MWQRALDLAAMVYELTRTLPPEERFGLQSQARRAAVSVAANIAEGRGRWPLKEFLHSLSMARSSLHELETQVELMVRIGYLREAEVQSVLRDSDQIGRMLAGLVKAVRRKLNRDNL